MFNGTPTQNFPVKTVSSKNNDSNLLMEMLERCRGDAVEMRWRCGGDAVEMRWRFGGDAVEMRWRCLGRPV